MNVREEAVVEEAIRLGVIRDKTYDTVRWGQVPDYRGKGEVVVEGQKYLVEGYGPSGNAHLITRGGGVNVSLL